MAITSSGPAGRSVGLEPQRTVAHQWIREADPTVTGGDCHARSAAVAEIDDPQPRPLSLAGLGLDPLEATAWLRQQKRAETAAAGPLPEPSRGQLDYRAVQPTGGLEPCQLLPQVAEHPGREAWVVAAIDQAVADEVAPVDILEGIEPLCWMRWSSAWLIPSQQLRDPTALQTLNPR